MRSTSRRVPHRPPSPSLLTEAVQSGARASRRSPFADGPSEPPRSCCSPSPVLGSGSPSGLLQPQWAAEPVLHRASACSANMPVHASVASLLRHTSPTPSASRTGGCQICYSQACPLGCPLTSLALAASLTTFRTLLAFPRRRSARSPLSLSIDPVSVPVTVVPKNHSTRLSRTHSRSALLMDQLSMDEPRHAPSPPPPFASAASRRRRRGCPNA